MAYGSDRKTHCRQRALAKGRQINTPSLQTVLDQKTVARAILIEITAITLLQLLKLQSNYAEILSQQE